MKGPIKIDMRLFHREVVTALKKSSYLALREMKEKTIMSLVDSLISFLFYRTPNFFCAPTGYYRDLFLYFTYEGLIEIFDELHIEFNCFFRDYGIGREDDYYVVRLSNFDTRIFKLEKGHSLEKIHA